MRTPGRFAGVAAVVLVLTTSAVAQTPPRRAGAMRHAGLSGSGAAGMQVVTMPVRVGRVAAVPGSNEFWAIGHSSSAAWPDSGPAGQLLFMRRTGSDPWRVVGPARGAGGETLNPTLFALALSRSGEGWAVGSDGLMLRRAPGSDSWIAVPQMTQSQLNGVSLSSDGGGFAVGNGATILRLSGSRWIVENTGTDLTADGLPNLVAVSAVSAEEAWAVSGSSSENLLVYRRTGGTWRRVRTNQRIFDGPSRPADGPNGGTVDAAFGSTIAATATGAWVGGMIFPSDAAHPFGDDTPGSASRPFAVRIASDEQTITSYCPDQYGVRARVATPGEPVEVDRTVMCDRPFPLSAFDLTSFAVFGSEVFAGGLGLYHFRGGGWFREPNAQGYVISLAMTSPREGWMATTGNTFGAGGAVHSSEATLGHWTTTPQTPRVARWPQAQTNPLEAVAIAPRGGRAVGVGLDGAVVTYEPGAGWDGVVRVNVEAMHAVAFAGAEEAWAVGEAGALQRFDGERWHRDPLSGVVSKGASLFGVAFRSEGDGVAVGARGTIMRYDGVRWTRDAAGSAVTGETLYAVAATPSGYVAVGAKGTVLEQIEGRWRSTGAVAGLLARPGLPVPALYAVAVRRDGTVLAGGASSALVVRRAGTTAWTAGSPFEGTILALAASPSGDAVYASVSPDAAKYRGDRLATTRGVILADDGSGWRDISLNRLRSIYPGMDSAAYIDPALGLAVGPDGAGWAVGGTPASQPDADGHLRTEPTSSIYRFDLDGDPVPPDMTADVDLPSGGFTFAAFGETWCGRGVCSATLGSGTQADMVALQIRREIEAMSKRQGGPAFVMFVGNGRAAGIPDELEQFKGYLDGYHIPVYGVLGDRELFAGFEDSAAGNAVRATNVRTGAGNDYWKEVFADRRAPWGERPAPKGFAAVEPAGSTGATAGYARTHYAFDYAPKGEPLLRVAVIDSSTKSYGRQTDQNPEESQGDWLERVLLDARGEVTPGDEIPTIVVMNQPTVIPDRTQVPNWLVDATTFEESVTRNAVTAVFAGGMRTNTSGAYTGATQVPLYILGGGGAPLGFEHATVTPSKQPSDGFYNAWHLVHVGPARPTTAGLPQAAITVRSFPVLESLAMHAVDGRSVAGGNTLRFSALARQLPGGSSDPDQSKATYFWMGSDAPVLCEERGQGNGGCTSRDALTPPYRFYSENPDIADFVKQDFAGGPRAPLVFRGEVVRDPGGQGGLLCTFKAGTAHINVVSGLHRARMALKVGGGSGPCVKDPVPPPPVVPDPIPEPEPPVIEPVTRPAGSFFPRGGESLSVVLPPPPAPVVAPAPPGAPGIGRKEEHEPSHETEGHGEQGKKHAFTARRERAEHPAGWQTLGALLLLSFMGAAVAAAARRRLDDPRRAVVSQRRSE